MSRRVPSHRSGRPRYRWEVVCRFHVQADSRAREVLPAMSWIVPVSEGRRPHRWRIAAWWEARALTSQWALDRAARIAAAKTPAERALARVLPATWEHRRLHSTPTRRRAHP